MSQRPECIKEYKKEAVVSDLYARIHSIVSESNKNFVEVTESNFREHFESAFKKDIAWKNRNGGISFEEFVATAEKEVPFKNSKENIEEGYITYKEGELFQWHDAAINEYCAKENITEDDFYEKEQTLISVPFTTSATAFIRYLSNYCFVSERQEEQLIKAYSKETDIQKLFDKINGLMSPELRATHVMDIDYPLPMKLYKLSNQ